MTMILHFLFLAQYVTGTCPDGFVPGTYGVGSCYIAHRELLQMAQAVIRCRDLYSARLLNIQSEQEDRFIKGFLLNNTMSGDFILISVLMLSSVASTGHFNHLSFSTFSFLLSCSFFFLSPFLLLFIHQFK